MTGKENDIYKVIRQEASSIPCDIPPVPIFDLYFCALYTHSSRFSKCSHIYLVTLLGSRCYDDPTEQWENGEDLRDTMTCPKSHKRTGGGARSISRSVSTKLGPWRHQDLSRDMGDSAGDGCVHIWKCHGDGGKPTVA